MRSYNSSASRRNAAITTASRKLSSNGNLGCLCGEDEGQGQASANAVTEEDDDDSGSDEEHEVAYRRSLSKKKTK